MTRKYNGSSRGLKKQPEKKVAKAKKKVAKAKKAAKANAKKAANAKKPSEKRRYVYVEESDAAETLATRLGQDRMLEDLKKENRILRNILMDIYLLKMNNLE